jgi:F-type H+-transporting ATPase subunit epsilon
MPVQLIIVTPEGVRYEGLVDRVVVPGTEGDFGVLPGHERFLSPIQIGELELEVPGANGHWAAVSDGFAEVSGDRVLLMVDSCEFAGDIDTARAERARARAAHEIELIRARAQEDRNYKLEEAALHRALIRLQVAAKHRAI